MSLNPLDYDYDWAAIIAFFALIVAILSAYYSYINGQKQSDRSFYVSWVDGVIEWTNRTCEILIRMKLNLEFEASLGDRREELIELSACIEQGRLLFENKNKDAWGKEKPYAYRGFRPTMLDELVAAYHAYSEYGNTDSHLKDNFVNFLEKRRRLFLSEIQQIITVQRDITARDIIAFTPRQDIRERRFTSAIRPHNRMNFPRRYFEREPTKDSFLAVINSGRQVIYLEHQCFP